MDDVVETGRIIKLDRGFPLVKLADGREIRCKHATALVKGERVRAVIGDVVSVSLAQGSDKALIVGVEPRRCELVRKDPTERAVPQVLAANFDRVIVTQPAIEVNMRRLERELVLAHETGAAVTVVLTKADLAESEDAVRAVRERVRALAGASVETLVVSAEEPESVEAVRALVPEGSVAVLIGKSGVGKSSLVNVLVGEEVQETGSVREADGAGRHTTVSREMVKIPGGGLVVDMPGVRGLGLWDADAGIGAAFADVEALAESCRFRDCKHENEPGCAVRAAVEAGELSEERYESYRALKKESADVRERREHARWMQREQAPASKPPGGKRANAKGAAVKGQGGEAGDAATPRKKRAGKRGGKNVGTGGSAGGRRTSAASSKMKRNKSGRGSGGSSWRNLADE